MSLPLTAARLSIAASVATVVLLAALHALSPEFDPSFRVVSEYADGRYPWVLSLMFAAWAVSSWMLVPALWPYLHNLAGRAGLVFLSVAGIGEAMASVFDIHHPLHDIAGALGVLGLPLAAIFISSALGRLPEWQEARAVLLWTANLTWVILVLMVVALMLIRKVNLVGYPNRLLVVLYCIWAIAAARFVRAHSTNDAVRFQSSN